MDKISPDELKELKEEVLNSTEKHIEKDTKIIFDGKQYSIRFPKRIIDEAELDKEDYFKIKLHIPEYSTGNKPNLIINLIRKNEETKT